jgi:hypothetical protein
MSTDEERLALLERAVRGLGREVEAARIAQDGLAAKTTVIDLRGQVAQLADQVADLPNLIPKADQSESYPVVSWLARIPDEFTASEVLAELICWVRLVHLRYADAATGLPECWLWHPEVVEELLWLMQAWRAAYLKPSIRAVGDWHDRLRPGVVRRITGYAGTCSLDNHRQHRAADRVEVPTADAAEAIADWWSGDPDRQAPEPTDQQIAAAFAAFNRRSRHPGGQS